MTTDWNELRYKFAVSPYYFTDNMKNCFVYDNPFGYSIKKLMLIFDETCDKVMLRFDIGLARYKYIKRKGGRNYK